jgi:hypothetical protein
MKPAPPVMTKLSEESELGTSRNFIAGLIK